MTNVLLGTCIADALGVFAEGSLPNNKELINWDGITFIGSPYHNLLPGFYSDDGQLSQILAESLISKNGYNPDDVSERYIEWISSGRARGYGRTTKAAIDNLINGKHWSVSGISASFGNGVGMRISPLAVFFRKEIKDLIDCVKIENGITHASAESEAGALAIALTAYYALNNDLEDLLIKISEYLPNSKVKEKLSTILTLVNAKHISVPQALKHIGTKADIRQTALAAIYLFLKLNNYEEAVVSAIRAGFDADTTAAVTGALFGAMHGTKGMRQEWIDGVENSAQLIEIDSELYNRK